MPSVDWTDQDRARYQVIFDTVKDHFDEKAKRLLGAAMALSLGHGGQVIMHDVTGLALDTLQLGISQLQGTAALAEDRVRRPGGGRKPITEIYPEIEDALLKLVAESTQGDPESPLLWTTKSLSHLAQALTDQGMPISTVTVSRLLTQHGYSMQANKKRFEGGSDHPDRDQQFAYIAKETKEFQAKGQPVISVDTKKKELIGNYKNGGREYREKGTPLEVNAHDFPNPKLGKAIPYGVYDPTHNTGWVNVGTDHDTAEFAVESIRQWWLRMGHERYPNATELLMTADGGGSNGYRLKLFKVELQKLADETGLAITISHLPPGTSKWNRIEHHMFSFISLNWRGRPLTSYEVVVELIGHTTTKSGLGITANLDRGTYETGKKVDAEALDNLLIEHPENQNQQWNYTIRPHVKTVTTNS